MLDLERFTAAFVAHAPQGPQAWVVLGFARPDGTIVPLNGDTKVLATVFELLAASVVEQVAQAAGYEVLLPPNQTTYPDFTLSRTDPVTGLLHRVAVDVKTTYRSSRMGITLGSYNAFIRNGTKNIALPYTTYQEHWVLGFVYTRGPGPLGTASVSPVPAGAMLPAYSDVRVFVRHKHDLAGLRPGSGNTKNIGSVKVSSAEAFQTVQGPFAAFTQAQAACDHYWKRYEAYQASVSGAQDLLVHPDFSSFR